MIKTLRFSGLSLAFTTILASTSLAMAQVTYTTFNGPEGQSTLLGISGNDIVGEYDRLQIGFLYNGSSFVDIRGPLGTFAIVHGVSNGTVVGFYDTPNGTMGFIFNDGAYTNLNVPNAMSTFPYAIDGTSIVGAYENTQGQLLGFLDQGGSFTTLSYPNATSTDAVGISGNTIVGNYFDSGVEHGFVYENGTYKTLDDPLGGNGTDIGGISGNTIVGDYYAQPTPGGGDVLHGFLYDGSNFTTLDDPLAGDTPGLSSTSLSGIYGNTIVGSYESDGLGSTQGLIIAAPEPSSVLLGLSALIFFGVLRACVARSSQPSQRTVVMPVL